MDVGYVLDLLFQKNFDIASHRLGKLFFKFKDLLIDSIIHVGKVISILSDLFGLVCKNQFPGYGWIGFGLVGIYSELGTNIVLNDPSRRLLHNSLIFFVIKGYLWLIVFRRDEISVLNFRPDRSDVLLSVYGKLADTLLEQILLIFQKFVIFFKKSLKGLTE